MISLRTQALSFPTLLFFGLLKDFFVWPNCNWVKSVPYIPWPFSFATHSTFQSLLQFSSVQFSCSVVSDSLRPHESQYTRPPCLSPTPGVYSNSCPLSEWRHPTISSSAHPLFLLPSVFPWIQYLLIKIMLIMVLCLSLSICTSPL